MYHECKLIHADLSEYNILYHQDELWIIDVSQSVEHDHPAASEFLRKDIRNVITFFEGFGVSCLGLRKAYEFVTTEALVGNGSKGEDEVLREWIEVEMEMARKGENRDGETDEVFFSKFIPRNLGDVLDPEKEIAKSAAMEEKKKEEVPARSPMRVRFTGVPQGKNESDDEDDDEEEEEESEDDNDEQKERVDARKPRGHRHENREAKKVCRPPIPQFDCATAAAAAVADVVFSGTEKGYERGTTREKENQDAKGGEEEADQE